MLKTLSKSKQGDKSDKSSDLQPLVSKYLLVFFLFCDFKLEKMMILLNKQLFDLMFSCLKGVV